ncbi:hypothetical protein ACFFRR_001889 [Megaselia abdita]
MITSASASTLFSRLRHIIATKPMVRGMISYSILWPTGSLLQQTMENKKFGDYDWKRVLRYSMYGSLYVAPTLHYFMRLTSHMWPVISLRTGIYKAVLDQMAYGPFAVTSFYLLMTLMESKTWDEACTEVKNKFFPTYKVGLCVWPILQTINYSFVPERNRLIYVSVCSLIWTSFLAYVKQMDAAHLAEFKEHQPHLRHSQN